VQKASPASVLPSDGQCRQAIFLSRPIEAQREWRQICPTRQTCECAQSYEHAWIANIARTAARLTTRPKPPTLRAPTGSETCQTTAKQFFVSGNSSKDRRRVSRALTDGSSTLPTYVCTSTGSKQPKACCVKLSSTSTRITGIGRSMAIIDPTFGMKFRTKVRQPQMNPSCKQNGKARELQCTFQHESCAQGVRVP
jgi:hypothetical protein